MTLRADEIRKLAPEEKRTLLAERLRARLEDELPLSHGQKALWLVNRLVPESPAYHVIFAARIVSSFDCHALEKAFQMLVDRHEALRTSFPTRDGEPFARVLSRLRAPFETVDVSRSSPAEILDELRRETERPFDLERGPVLRVRLFVRSEGEAYLAATFHHIAIDGWSLWIGLSEIAELYRAARDSRPPDLPAVERGFRHHTRWQSELLSGPEGRRLRSYWVERLGDQLPVLDLPADRARPPVPRLRGASVRLALDAKLSERLRDFSKTEGATLQMTLLALFQALLYRYTSQEDFPLGTLASGRSRTELEDVVGYLANPLVLRARVDGESSFRELLKRTRESILDAFDHQDYPFPLLVEELEPGRDPSRSPLFQTLFVFERAQRLSREGAGGFILGESGSEMRLGDLVFEALPFTAQHEGQFDLILLLAEHAGRVAGYFDYNTDLFEEATIRRLAGHFLTLARSATAEPDRPLSRLPMLADEERRALRAWNETRAEYPPACLHELFERQVRRAPGAVAAVFESEALSYAELDARANRLARELTARGVRRGSLVGLAVDRSLDLVTGMLGIAKAGGAFVPLDAAYPADRIAFMMADSGQQALVTQRALLDRLPPFAGTVVCVDETASSDAGGGRRPDPGTVPDDVAYVIYTSGSTGRPKGVLVPHRGLSTLAAEQQRLFGVGPGWRVLQFSSLSFDASIFEIVMALASGASLHLGAMESLLPGRPLLEKLKREAISIVTLPPSALTNLPVDDLPDLRTVTVAGEPCPAELVAHWARGRRFFNLYGPTESTIWATYAECTDAGAPPPIGRPIANTRVYVLDPNLQEVPVGVRGELYIGGEGIARGYLGRPELTASRFVPDPFDRAPGARLYRTGDLVRRRSDGELEYVGRLDFQVKIRGFRIELGEIEAVLLQHPGVKEAVVTVSDEGSADRRLVAYYVPREPEGVDASLLRRHLTERLPGFMQPSAFVSLPRLPRLPGGKIDRNALSPPAVERSIAPSPGPRTELEETIAAIWRTCLGVDSVDVHDNFFDVGGNSLLIARVGARLDRALGKSVPIVDLFQFPTIRALASHLSERKGRPQEESETRAQALAGGKDRLKRLRERRSRAPAARTTD